MKQSSVNIDCLTLLGGGVIVAMFEIGMTRWNVFNPNFNLRSLPNTCDIGKNRSAYLINTQDRSFSTIFISKKWRCATGHRPLKSAQ
jgi:hypothetical protein